MVADRDAGNGEAGAGMAKFGDFFGVLGGPARKPERNDDDALHADARRRRMADAAALEGQPPTPAGRSIPARSCGRNS